MPVSYTNSKWLPKKNYFGTCEIEREAILFCFGLIGPLAWLGLASGATKGFDLRQTHNLAANRLKKIPLRRLTFLLPCCPRVPPVGRIAKNVSIGSMYLYSFYVSLLMMSEIRGLKMECLQNIRLGWEEKF